MVPCSLDQFIAVRECTILDIRPTVCGEVTPTGVLDETLWVVPETDQVVMKSTRRETAEEVHQSFWVEENALAALGIEPLALVS
jgi:hypothetical protein